MKILIVDDDWHVRDLFRVWLEREGFLIYEAENGKKAVEVHKNTPIDLLICDLIMPVQEGIETIRQFQDEFPEIGIIAISGGGQSSPDSYLSMAELLGAWRVFSKPIAMVDVISSIHKWKEQNWSGTV